MKIYHKPSFFCALIDFAYAFSFPHLFPDAGISAFFPTITFSLIGLHNLYYSMNKKKAKELIIRDSDERLVLQHLKCYRAAFWTTCGLLLLITLTCSHFLDPSTHYTVALTTSLTSFFMLLIYITFNGILSLRNR